MPQVFSSDKHALTRLNLAIITHICTNLICVVGNIAGHLFHGSLCDKKNRKLFSATTGTQAIPLPIINRVITQ